MKRIAPTLALLLATCAACRSAPPRTVERRVEVGDSYLHVDETGSGPAVVFVHGGQMDSSMWDEQVETFAPTNRVVRVDVRGFGRSGPVSDPYASHEDLHAVVEALELSNFTLVGLSLGGRIAVDYALDRPGRLDGLVLVAPGLSGWSWSDPDHAFFDDIVAAVAAGDTARAVELWLECPYMAPAMERPELAPRLRRLAAANERAWTIPPVERPREPPAVTELAKIATPTLLVVGDRDVSAILRIVDLLERELPDARRVDLPGVGHLPNLEARERFDEELGLFLEEVAAR